MQRCDHVDGQVSCKRDVGVSFGQERIIKVDNVKCKGLGIFCNRCLIGFDIFVELKVQCMCVWFKNFFFPFGSCRDVCEIGIPCRILCCTFHVEENDMKYY